MEQKEKFKKINEIFIITLFWTQNKFLRLNLFKNIIIIIYEIINKNNNGLLKNKNTTIHV